MFIDARRWPPILARVVGEELVFAQGWELAFGPLRVRLSKETHRRRWGRAEEVVDFPLMPPKRSFWVRARVGEVRRGKPALYPLEDEEEEGVHDS